jgi:hypothetical protein
MFEIANTTQSARTAEGLWMDAHASSPQYDLVASGGPDALNPRGNWSDGDFAAGLRRLQSDAGVRGDFATGMRDTPLFMTPGDFATGQRTDPAAELVRGDFATGQRAEQLGTPSRDGQLERRGRSSLWHSTVAVARRAS